MTPLEFLQAVWPSAGHFILATPWLIPESQKWTYRHKVFSTPEAAAAFAAARAHTNVFFGVHSLTEREVWNPNKLNWRTGLKGANESRTQANSHAARCFYLDLDIGDAASKYATQADALLGLRAFCQTVGLPRPMVVSSGSGLHVYWLLTDELPSEVWRGHARKLKALTLQHGLRADPSRTADSASVLRVVGTTNLKGDAPLPVAVLAPAGRVPTEDFIARLDAAVIRAALVVPVETPFTPSPLDLNDLGSNTEPTYNGPPTTLKAVAEACELMRAMMRARGKVSEPEWYHTLNLVRFLENGTRIAHKISEGHPNYTPADTDAKIAQLEAKAVAPTSCTKLAEVTNGAAVCAVCPFHGKVRSPIVAARYRDPAPPPVVTQMAGLTPHTVTVPEPPWPYIRMKSGGISFQAKNKEGDEVNTIIYDNDLYPVRRLVNTAARIEQQTWRVTFPRGGAKDFTLDADALYDQRKFMLGLTHQGIYPARSNIQHVQDYMVAYIAELQRLADAEAQNTHLGWTEEHKAFILPDRVINVDGTVAPSTLSTNAAQIAADITQRGTLERQVELMRFYNHPAYTPNQFFMLAGLASPIFYATDHYGVLVNASGQSGASKSTSLYAAGAFWGQPQRYVLDGNDKMMSTRGRANRLVTLSNLPFMLDEITKMERKDIGHMVMAVSQLGRRIVLNQDGTERATAESNKSSISLTTANNSVHNALSSDNSAATAGSMRVVEIMFREQKVHAPHEANDFVHELKANYGHIGQQFVAYVVANRDTVTQRVRAMQRELEDAAQAIGAERFWFAVAASALVAGEIAHDLGLLSFPVATIKHWFLTQQIPAMRGVVVAEYASPLGVLTDYLESINHDIVVSHAVEGMGGNLTTSNVIRGPRGPLHGHYDTGEQVMWCLRKSFKDYCNRIGANFIQILGDLHTPRLDASGKLTRIVVSPQMRRVLGQGTPWSKAQSWCFALNMSHPDITGMRTDLTKPDQQARPQPAGKPQLKVVV